METWVKIRDFSDYSVSNLGRVRNDSTDRIMALLRNQHGVVNVGLTKGGRQYKRSVAKLVAHAFLPPASSESFDTPIHLDGDQSNNHVENLEWRPRWYAVRYQTQFNDVVASFSYNTPIRNKSTGEVFDDSKTAAVRYGLLDSELCASIINRTYVWPLYQCFELVEV